MIINPDHFVSDGRQQQLIDLAERGYYAAAIRNAIRETVLAVNSGEPATSVIDHEEKTNEE